MYLENKLAFIGDATAFLPMSLNIFLKGLFTSSDAQIKTASIGQAIVQTTRPRVVIAPHFREGTCVQYVADNVDHNICMLDGHYTFYGMGMIAAVTPAISRTGRIPRVSVAAEGIAAIEKINIEHFISESDGSQSLQDMNLELYDTEDTCGDICQQYVRYISKHYGTPFIVFDGYLGGQSTKDVVH